MSVTIFSRSSVKGIDRVILEMSAIRKQSKDSFWKSESEKILNCVRQNYDKKDRKRILSTALRASLKRSKATLNGSSEGDLMRSFYNHYSRYYYDDSTVMTYFNDQQIIFHKNLLTRWEHLTDSYDKMEVMLNSLDIFRMSCSREPILEGEIDCATCNPFVEKPEYIFIDEGYHWITKRFKVELQVHNKLNLLEAERFHSSVFHRDHKKDFYIPVNLNDELGLIGFEVFYSGVREIETIGDDFVFNKNNLITYGVFTVNHSNGQSKYYLTEENSTAFKSLLIMISHYKQSNNMMRQRGCIESLIWGGQNELLFAHSIDILTMFSRAEDNKGFYLADLSFLGNFHVIFGSETEIGIDLKNDNCQVLWVLYNFSKESAMKINLAMLLSINYGLDMNSSVENCLSVCNRKVLTCKSISGLKNKASKKYIFEFCSISNDLLETGYRCYEKLKMSEYAKSLKFKDIKNFKLNTISDWDSSNSEELELFKELNEIETNNATPEIEDSVEDLKDSDKEDIDKLLGVIDHVYPYNFRMDELTTVPPDLNSRGLNEFYKKLDRTNAKLETNFMVIKERTEEYLKKWGIEAETDISLINRKNRRSHDELMIFSEVRKKKGLRIDQVVNNEIRKEIALLVNERLGEPDELLKFEINNGVILADSREKGKAKAEGKNSGKGVGKKTDRISDDLNDPSMVYSQVPSIFKRIAVNKVISNVSYYKKMFQGRNKKGSSSKGGKNKKGNKAKRTAGRVRLNNSESVEEFIDSFKISVYQNWKIKFYGTSRFVKNRPRNCLNKTLLKQMRSDPALGSYFERLGKIKPLDQARDAGKNKINTGPISKYLIDSGQIKKLRVILSCYSLTGERSSRCVDLLMHKMGISGENRNFRISKDEYRDICLNHGKINEFTE